MLLSKNVTNRRTELKLYFNNMYSVAQLETTFNETITHLKRRDNSIILTCFPCNRLFNNTDIKI